MSVLSDNHEKTQTRSEGRLINQKQPQSLYSKGKFGKSDHYQTLADGDDIGGPNNKSGIYDEEDVQRHEDT